MNLPKETNKRAFVALINGKGEVLIALRAAGTNNPGQWGLPGGHLNEHESIEEGARRELLEELGVDYDFTRRSYMKVHADHKRTLLFIKADPPTLAPMIPNPEEVESIQWLPLNKLTAIPIKDRHRSLELALPALISVEPVSLVEAFVMTHRGVSETPALTGDAA